MEDETSLNKGAHIKSHTNNQTNNVGSGDKLQNANDTNKTLKVIISLVEVRRGFVILETPITTLLCLLVYIALYGQEFITQPVCYNLHRSSS